MFLSIREAVLEESENDSWEKYKHLIPAFF
jgi:hypothetical protein